MFAMFWTRVKRKRTSKANSSLGSCSSDCADPKGALSIMRYLRESQAYEGVQSRRSLNLSIVVTGLPLDPGGILMKIALIGASGFVGSKILAEALQRGHQVTAIVRNPEKIQPQENLTVKKIDVLQTDELARLLAGHDAIISSFNPGRGVAGAEVYDKFVQGHKSIIAAVKKSGVKRFLGVGGAASLKTAEDIEFLESPTFPKEYEPYKPGIRGTRELYYLLKQEPTLDWIFLAPSSQIAPGERTGKFRLGKDHLLFDEKDASKISLEDYAIAMIDELERPQHHRERFTVGY